MSFGDKAALPADEGPVAVDLKGFLHADEAGAYQLSVDLKSHDAVGKVFPTTCFVQAWVGDKVLGPRSITIADPVNRDATGSLLLNVDLSPGIYPLRMWLQVRDLAEHGAEKVNPRPRGRVQEGRRPSNVYNPEPVSS